MRPRPPAAPAGSTARPRSAAAAPSTSSRRAASRRRRSRSSAISRLTLSRKRLVVGDLAGQPIVLGLRRRACRPGRHRGSRPPRRRARPRPPAPAPAARAGRRDRRWPSRRPLAAMLALEIGLGLRQPRAGFLLRLGDALGFGGQRIVRHPQALQRGRRGGLVVAQRRQRRRGLGLRRGGETDQARQIGDLGLGLLQPLAGLGELALGVGELQRQHGGFGAADMVGEVAIAAGLARLALQALVLLFQAPPARPARAPGWLRRRAGAARPRGGGHRGR